MDKTLPAPRPPLARLVGAHVIHPRAVYTLEQARQALGLKATTLKTEIRKRRLRVSKRAGRCFVLGDWLLEWLRAGEDRRGDRPQEVDANGE